MESEALSWETRIVEPRHRGTADREVRVGIVHGIVPKPCQGQDTLHRKVVIAEVDAVKTRITRGGRMDMELHVCSVFNFQSSVRSLNPPLGNIPASSLDAGNQGTELARWVTEPDS